MIEIMVLHIFHVYTCYYYKMKKKETAYRTRKEMGDKPGYVRCANLQTLLIWIIKWLFAFGKEGSILFSFSAHADFPCHLSSVLDMIAYKLRCSMLTRIYILVIEFHFNTSIFVANPILIWWPRVSWLILFIMLFEKNDFNSNFNLQSQHVVTRKKSNMERICNIDP